MVEGMYIMCQYIIATAFIIFCSQVFK